MKIEGKLIVHIRQKYLKSIQLLTTALKACDDYTEGHSLRVTHYSLLIAKKLRFSKQKMRKLRVAAILHDIGKIMINQEILNKPAKLTVQERNQIKIHPLRSVEILRPTISDKEILEIIKHHHEYWNGKGYPDSIKGSQIPLSSRIMQVCDAFDAMTTDRPYRKAMSFKSALEELDRCSGSQFDPSIVKIFVKIPRKKIVQIQNFPPDSFHCFFYDGNDETLDFFSNNLTK